MIIVPHFFQHNKLSRGFNVSYIVDQATILFYAWLDDTIRMILVKTSQEVTINAGRSRLFGDLICFREQSQTRRMRRANGNYL